MLRFPRSLKSPNSCLSSSPVPSSALLLPVAAPLLLSFFIGMAVKEAKINKYTELLEEGLSYFGTFFLGLILGVLCEASTILNPTVIIILVIGISCPGYLRGGRPAGRLAHVFGAQSQARGL